MQTKTALRVAVVGFCLGVLVIAGAQQRQPDFHTQPPKPSSAYDEPMTGYEVAVITAEFILNLERGLSQAFDRPINTASAGAVSLSGKHPEWAREALKTLKARGAIPPKFSGSKPMPRYQVGQMLAQYVQRLDSRLRQQMGAPIGRVEFQTLPTIRLDRKHPAYSALRMLARGGWVMAEAPLYREPLAPIQGKELPSMLRDVANRALERYRDEPHLKE